MSFSLSPIYPEFHLEGYVAQVRYRASLSAWFVRCLKLIRGSCGLGAVVRGRAATVLSYFTMYLVPAMEKTLIWPLILWGANGTTYLERDCAACIKAGQ
ncbi:unknown protein [Desulfotalea psychrophila LSv54]|uniref:Uncharacterized protein n=1 Tax=Desulfotalea psychrophila (strain LSv54 / DSM 12343) TaxID=177439 RepID=Q6ARX5_DESPS|nr:unknown protein [Desulfotalea psychrophila LSv54]